MKIPKLSLFKKQRAPEQKGVPPAGAPPEQALDGILARRSAPRKAGPGADPLGSVALGGLRRPAPRPEPSQAQPQPEAPPPAEAPAREEPAAPVAPEPAAEQPPAPGPGPQAVSVPANEPQPPASGEERPAPEDDALAGLEAAGEEESGDDLLDIFRDAKDESEESSLVDELDDVAIDELLTDVVGLSQQLGVTPTNRSKKQAPAVAPVAHESDDADIPAEEPVLRPAAPEAEPEDEPAPDPVPREDAAPEPEQPPVKVRLVSPKEAPAPRPVPEPQPPVAQKPAADPPPQMGQAGRQQMLHVLVVGLSLALIAGIVGGARGADGLFAAAHAEPTPAVLAYLRTPAESATPSPVVTPSPAPTPDPTPSPSPAPSATPTPSPAPTPGAEPPAFDFDPLAPAYYVHQVESGDSLTSISWDFSVCPDHILWNNPPRTENDPLYIGERLVMPGMPGIVHNVQPGDTVHSLAARYSVHPEAIVAFPGNHLDSADDLSPGMRVLIPHGIPPDALLQSPEAYEKTHSPSEHGLVWPYAGPVTTYYGEQRPNYLHLAIDIGGLGTYGQPVVSVADGRVVFVEYGDVDYGNHVIVDHGDGRRSHYAHFQDVYVAQGDEVRMSQPLGTIGCTGASTGTHLHFELWVNGVPIDPLPLLP